MEPNLREHFEQAVRDDPGFPLGDMARAAIAEGGELRRRRRNRLAVPAVAAGVVVVIGAIAGLSMRPEHTEPPMTIAAAMMPVTAPSCLEQPVESNATDVAIFLTGDQQATLHAKLTADPRIAVLSFESPEQAYQKFRLRWADSPDFAAAVTADQFPASFRLRLKSAEQYTALRSDYATVNGVHSIVGRRCTVDAPVGGTL